MDHTISRPIALTVAGSDSSGGAGIQADLKTFFTLGCYGASALTALTAQNTTGVQGVFPVPAEFVDQQIKSVLDDLDVRAIKTGMLANAAIVETVADRCARARDIPLIVDPVMVATSGDLLIEENAVDAMRSKLFPLASIITPNLGEAAALLGAPQAASNDEMVEQATALLDFGSQSVLLKGGHLADEASPPQAHDVLVTASGHAWFSADWVKTTNTHGTGCTLAAAIAAGQALGSPLAEAVDAAKSYLTRALQSGAEMSIGRGNGPVDHLVDHRQTI